MSAKYGEVSSIIIPRPTKNGDAIPGLAKVFVKFAQI